MGAEDTALIHWKTIEVDKLKAEVAELKAEILEMSENPGGDYYTGLRCGVEDINCKDMYEAVEYGWDQAFEYVNSCRSTTPHPEAKQ